jgi:hypothetical protein
MSTTLLLILQRIPQLVPPDTTTITTSALREHIKGVDKANKQAIEQTISLREKFLTEQAQALAAVRNQTESSARISLLNRERMKSAKRHLRHLLNTHQLSPGLSRIMVPVSPSPTLLPTDPTTTDPVTYQTVRDSKEIDRILLKRNALHYSQAKETPLDKSQTALFWAGTAPATSAKVS